MLRKRKGSPGRWIPDSITKIGARAFDGCASLTEITIPNAVTEIGDYAFSNCSSLTAITIPDSVENIGEEALYAGKNLKQVFFNRVRTDFSDKWFDTEASTPVFPEDAFATRQKLPAEYCKAKLGLSEKEIAFLLLYQRGKSWQTLLREKTAKKEKSVFNCLTEKFGKDEKASADVLAEFLVSYARNLAAEQVKAGIELLKQRKYEKLKEIKNNPEIKSIISGESVEEHPVEALVRKLTARYSVPKEVAGVVKKGIPYAGSDRLCSADAVTFILSEYVKEWKRCATTTKPNWQYNTTVEVLNDGSKVAVHEKADEVAAALDRTALSEMCEKLCSGAKYRPWILAWARYADDSSVERMTSAWKTMYKGKGSDHYKASNIKEALFINDTPAAMRFFDRIGDLERYAQRRGIAAVEIRDSLMLPAFAFDPDGIKRYDIGGNTVEVSINPDLSFRLFDVNQQKEIRSFPKKSDNSKKAEACAKDYAEFKKTVLDFARERTALLHKMHMSGEYVKPELWQKVYVERPVIKHLTQLIVWQDETGKTFMTLDGTTVDSTDNPYAPQGRVRVAHVIDMKPEETAQWQRWLKKHGLVQLFEQVWEPVINWQKESIADRYDGVTISNSGRNALKKALGLRGVEMRSSGVSVDIEYQNRWDYDKGHYVFGDTADMLFGDVLKIGYKVEYETKAITFNKAAAQAEPGNREINAVLLELDKAVLAAQIVCDNDAALTDKVLSEFTAAQIASFLSLAIENKATRCTAWLLNYKNECFPEFEDVNEFSLEW